jgi:hypothetical protein
MKETFLKEIYFECVLYQNLLSKRISGLALKIYSYRRNVSIFQVIRGTFLMIPSYPRKVEEAEAERKLNRTQNFLVLCESVYLFSKNINTTKKNTKTQTLLHGIVWIRNENRAN